MPEPDAGGAASEEEGRASGKQGLRADVGEVGVVGRDPPGIGA